MFNYKPLTKAKYRDLIAGYGKPVYGRQPELIIAEHENNLYLCTPYWMGKLTPARLEALNLTDRIAKQKVFPVNLAWDREFKRFTFNNKKTVLASLPFHTVFDVETEIPLTENLVAEATIVVVKQGEAVKRIFEPENMSQPLLAVPESDFNAATWGFEQYLTYRAGKTRKASSILGYFGTELMARIIATEVTQ